MARPSAKQVDARSRDLDEKLTNNMVAALWSGVSLIFCVIVLAALAGTGLFFGREHGGVQGAKLGVLVGLLVGGIVMGLLLRVNSDRIRARGDNLYRGMWAGLILALILIAIMAFAPELLGATPPPGQDPTS